MSPFLIEGTERIIGFTKIPDFSLDYKFVRVFFRVPSEGLISPMKGPLTVLSDVQIRELADT